MDAFCSSISASCNGGGLSHLPQAPSTSTCTGPALPSIISTTSNSTPIMTATNTAANPHIHAHTYSYPTGSLPAHTTLHVSTAPLDVGLNDAARMDELRRILRLLADVSHGRHQVVWAELVDPRQPAESARKIAAALARSTVTSSAVDAIAACITTPAHLAIVAALEAPFRVSIRDAVLQELLTALTTARNPGPMPVCSEMLAEMVRLNLVVLRGVATTLERLLDSPVTRRAAIAVLGRIADQNRGDGVFLQAVQNVEPLVRRIKEPEYDYDCITIARLLGWSTAERGGGGTAATPSLVPVKTIEESCTVTSMAYFRQRDELVSATCDGSVVIWGGPNALNGDMRASVTIDLPQNCVPIAMDGPPRGNYLVIAGMPFPAGNLCAMMNEGGSGYGNNNNNNSSNNNITSNGGSSNRKRNILSTPAKGPVLRFLTCSESTGSWANCETITRKEHVTLTAVAALSNFVVGTAESIPAERSTGSGMQHDLLLLNGHNAQTLQRLEHVHDDYTTVLRVGEEGEHMLISGSRDCVVKVWDTRSSSSGGSRPALSTAVAANTTATTTGGAAAIPTHRLKHTHTDTITAILPHRKALLTASLDGSLLMWDTRRMTTPLWETHMTAPIIDVTPADGGNVVVATARDLTLLSLESHRAQDIISNVVHTQLRSNADGTVIFAAGGVNTNSSSSSSSGGKVVVYALRWEK